MLDWVLGNVSRKKGKKRRKRAARKPPAYDKAKEIAAKGNAQERADLAAHEDLPPELLYYLAEDAEPGVRREVAENQGTPLQADKILAADADDEVRSELARKIGRLVPTLTDVENERLTTMAIEVLEVLARDSLPQVRAIVAEEIKLAANVPPDIVRRLAEDIEEIVAAPILEYSPLLSNTDLIEIIAGGIGDSALAALARREDLMEPVVDAIVDIRNVEALQSLLGNKSVQIREETLDIVAIVATGATQLHRPMVNRENLPLKTIKRIAGFVSASLVDRLIERNEIDDELARELRLTVRRRIEKGNFPDDGPSEGIAGELAGKEEAGGLDEKEEVGPEEDDDEAYIPADERAKSAMEGGKLDETRLNEALDKKDTAFVRHALVLMSELPMAMVSKMLNTGSGKGVTALAWKAGLSMEMALRLQTQLARIKPNGLVEPLDDGGCPMSVDDLEWYVEYYSV